MLNGGAGITGIEVDSLHFCWRLTGVEADLSISIDISSFYRWMA
jgi:hypothetical protein